MSDFVVDFISLSDWSNSLSTNVYHWNNELTGAINAIDRTVNDQNIDGRGVMASKQYFERVYSYLHGALTMVLYSFEKKSKVYKGDYTVDIDTDPEAIIKSEELQTIITTLNSCRKEFENQQFVVTSALDNVSDIFYTTRPRLDSVYDIHKTTSDSLDRLIDDIIALENNHVAGDFTEIESAITTIHNFISDLLNKPKNFKQDFTDTSLLSIDSFVPFANAYNTLYTDIEKNQKKYAEADKRDEEHIKLLEEARKEREKKGKWVKVTIGVVGVIASVAVIAATGGTAAPLVIGTVGAVTAAVDKAADTLVDTYTGTGDLRNFDGKKFAFGVGVHGAVGFIGGFAGGYVSKGLEGTKFITKGLKSTNLLIRSGTAGGVGSVEEIVEGAFKRIGDEVIDVYDSGDIKDFDPEVIVKPKELFKDAVAGFAKNATGEAIDYATERVPIGKGKKHFDSDYLNSDDALKRNTSRVIYGATKETAEGISGRGAEELVDSGNINKAAEKAFAPDEMLKDAISGGGKGTADAITRKEVGRELDSDDFKSSTVRESLPNNAPDYKQWRENGGSIYRDSKGKFTYKNASEQRLTFNEDGTANYDRAKTGRMKDYSNQKWRYHFNKNNVK